MTKLHTIIGAGGSIGSNLSDILIQKGESVSIVSRSAKHKDGYDSKQANALNKSELMEALHGSSIVYLLIGIQYDIKVWERDWPIIMQNTIDVCSELNIPLIFFDNVYMYGQVRGEMTEETPFKPVSKKGVLRAKVATMLLEAVKAGKIKAMIARSADFYGPYSEQMSFFHAMVLKNLMQGKQAQWMIQGDLPHSLTFTEDAAHALYLLGKDETCWNQTWHMPTAKPTLTGNELIAIASEVIGKPQKTRIISKWMLRILGFFIPVIKENMEMLYQVSEPYIFSSAKFEKHFSFNPTSYKEGIKKSIEHAKKMPNA